jgi:tetratricopeptide (TPR) repeat protein
MTPFSRILFSVVILSGLFFSACSTQQRIAEEKAPDELPAPVGQIKQLESSALLIDGSKQKMLGNLTNAIVLYAEALERDPLNSAAAYELAKLHAQQGHVIDAEKFIKHAVRIEPENVYYNLLLADIYFLQQKNEEGLKVQRELARQHPNDLNIQISLLSTLLYTEKYEESIAVIDHIETISGFNNELSMQKQQILMEMGETVRAIEEAERLISFFPDEPVFIEALADLYTQTGQTEKAFELYQRMLEVQPENAMARLLLADYYRNAGDEERSYQELKKAFQSEQFTIEGKARILYSYYFMSEDDALYLEQAYELIDIMLELHPDDPEANAIYGDFLYREERLEEAREYFYRAALIEPSELRFWQQTLIIDSQLNDYDNLLKVSEEALEYFFEQPVLYFFNGLAHFQKDNYEEAAAAFRYGRDLTMADPDFQIEFLTLLGDTYHRLDNNEASDRAYLEALAIDPDNALALNNYSYYLSLRNMKLTEAKEMSARSLEIEPDNAAYLDTYGWINYKLGNYQEAQKWIKKSIENSETPSPTVLEHYGDVLYKLGEKEEAVQYWEKALKAKAEDDFDKGSELLEKKVRDQKLYE